MQFHRIKHSCKYSVCFLSAFCILHSEGSSFPGLMSIIDVNYHLVFVCPPYFVFWRLSIAVPRTLQTMCLQNIISWPLDIMFGWSFLGSKFGLVHVGRIRKITLNQSPSGIFLRFLVQQNTALFSTFLRPSVRSSQAWHLNFFLIICFICFLNA